MTDLSKLQGDAEKFLGKREQFPDHYSYGKHRRN